MPQALNPLCLTQVGIIPFPLASLPTAGLRTLRFKTSDQTAIDSAVDRCKKDGWNRAKKWEEGNDL